MHADPHDDDAGFTLIELLVVVIILGVLGAISVTNFLGQRSKGYDAQTRSDLRNAATAMETYIADDSSNGYPASGTLAETVLASAGYRRSSSASNIRIVTVGSGGAETFKLSAFSQSGRQWCLNSASGSKAEEGPVTGADFTVPPTAAQTSTCP